MVLVSTARNGSSSRISRASCKRSRANSTRWNWPPDKEPITRSAKSSRPSVASAAGHRPLALRVDAAPDADLAPQPHGNAVEHRHGEAAVDVDLLRQIGDLVPVEPMQVDRAIEGSKLTHDALEQSRLAGAVGPDKREQLALFHLAGDMVHGRMAIIAKREIVQADGNARAHASTQAMQSQSRRTATPPMARRAGTARRNSEKPKRSCAEAGGCAPLPPVRPVSRGGRGGVARGGAAVPGRAMVASPLCTPLILCFSSPRADGRPRTGLRSRASPAPARFPRARAQAAPPGPHR